MQPLQIKRQPERKCIGCSEKKPKKDLIRIVRTPDGCVVLDSTGKLSGRGAYLCPSRQCLAKVKKAKRLGYALDCTVEDTVYEALEEQLKIYADSRK